MPATAAYVTRLRRNADLYHTGEACYEEFRVENGLLWRAIEARGQRFTDRVKDLLRVAGPYSEDR